MGTRRRTLSWGGDDLVYHGGPVQRRPDVYLVFWGWSQDPDGVAPYLTKFVNHFGGSAWYDTVTQYFSAAQGSIKRSHKQLAGTWHDTSSAPFAAEYGDIANEAVKAAAHFGYQSNAAYLIATPYGQDPDGFGVAFCAYHGVTPSARGNVAFVALPYMPDGGTACGSNAVNQSASGILDGVSIVAGHELAETETDPDLDAWFDVSGFEVADKCQWQNLANVPMSGAAFAVQPLWSNDANNGAGGCTLAFRQ
jgi:serine protease